ncbi:hypothetical protein CRE_31191 [Caenorhabditis remanei]|uniref:Uncharacterized protein n=1 Tax=Caenorhabditis remanei TaxID=31234 RepID=E3MLI1_CAERE|nr:hypothetical protein CRE_31191 [Caenorhabditis remanei]
MNFLTIGINCVILLVLGVNARLPEYHNHPIFEPAFNRTKNSVTEIVLARNFTDPDTRFHESSFRHRFLKAVLACMAFIFLFSLIVATCIHESLLKRNEDLKKEIEYEKQENLRVSWDNVEENLKTTIFKECSLCFFEVLDKFAALVE